MTAPITFTVPFNGRTPLPRWPNGLTEGDIDWDRVRELFGRVFAVVAEELMPEYEARELNYHVEGAEADGSPGFTGWLRFVVWRVSTGELLASALWHWTAAVKPGWSPPPPPPGAPAGPPPDGASRWW